MKEPDKDQNRMRKVSIAMERFWLVLAILSLIAVFYFFAVDGVNQRTIQFLVFPGLAGIMYAFRATFRKRFENRNSRD